MPLVQKFSPGHETLLVFAVTLCRAPHSLSNHSKPSTPATPVAIFPSNIPSNPFFITYRVASSPCVSVSPPGSVKYNTHSFFLSYLLYQKRLLGAQDENCVSSWLKKNPYNKNFTEEKVLEFSSPYRQSSPTGI